MRFISLVMAIIMTIIFAAGPVLAADLSVRMAGEELTLDRPPVIMDGTTLVPVRPLAEALGATVGWEQEIQRVTITNGKDFVTLQIGQAQAQVNGQEVTLRKPALVMAGRTMVPLRFVGEALACQVHYDEAEQTIYVEPGREMGAPGESANLTPICGEPAVSLVQAEEWLAKRAPQYVHLVALYWSIAPKYGVRPDVALAQACKETGFFRFTGVVQPEQNNFCGLGATGPDNPGACFPDPATGVEAHIQHLYAYATDGPLPEGTDLVDPRFRHVRRGSACYVEHLGAGENPTGVGWAYPGIDYGQSIVSRYLHAMLGK
ncbi:MAG: stalk domain-containing protein [Bacillota bacterium]